MNLLAFYVYSQIKENYSYNLSLSSPNKPRKKKNHYFEIKQQEFSLPIKDKS